MSRQCRRAAIDSKVLADSVLTEGMPSNEMVKKLIMAYCNTIETAIPDGGEQADSTDIGGGVIIDGFRYERMRFGCCGVRISELRDDDCPHPFGLGTLFPNPFLSLGRTSPLQFLCGLSFALYTFFGPGNRPPSRYWKWP